MIYKMCQSFHFVIQLQAVDILCETMYNIDITKNIAEKGGSLMKNFTIILLTLSVISLIIIGLYNLICTTNGKRIKNVIYKSDNIIIQLLQKGNGKNLAILGGGYSMSIDSSNRVIKHDPFMVLPSPKRFKKTTTIMSIYYTFESKGIEASGKEIATFVNQVCNNYENVSLIGHSKCGVCFANAKQWIKRKLLALVTISSPFEGTPLTTKGFDEDLSPSKKKIFNFIYSKHQVDLDIGENADFIKNADYSTINKDCQHYNFVSTRHRSLNPVESFTKWFTDDKIGADLVVPVKSQKVNFEGTKEIIIDCTHMTSMDASLKIITKKLDL